MRAPLEYRVWEKYSEDYAEEVGESGEMHYTSSDEEFDEKRTFVIAGFYHDSGFDREDFTIMQFTGLYDIEKKKIFEDDIIRGETTLPMKIIWHKYQWAVEYISDGSITIETIDDGFLHYMKSENFKVIGNIHEKISNSCTLLN